MKQEQRDPYDIKKFEEVLDESYMMIPDSEGRLEKSLADLSHFLRTDEYCKNEGQHSEWYDIAQQIIERHVSDVSKNSKLKSSDDFEVHETDVNGLKDDEAF